MSDETASARATQNGYVLPLDWQGVSADTLARLELAYQEIECVPPFTHAAVQAFAGLSR